MKKILFLIILIVCPTFIYALDLESKNYIMYNLDNNDVILEQGGKDKVSIASLTKIATAIVTIENADNINETIVLTDEVFIGLKEANASVAGFRVGQTVTIKDLLYGLILPSGADAANALLLYFDDKDIDLVYEMNKLAKKLNLEATTFKNTTGLDEDGHKSSVYDVSKLLMYALKNDEFKEIFTKKKYLTSDKSITFTHTLETTSKYFNTENPYIIGSKTGYETSAGLCLASIATINDIDYLLVTVGASRSDRANHLKDQNEIYKYVSENYEYKSLASKDDIVYYLNTLYATKRQYNVLVPEDIKIYASDSYKKDDYKYVYDGIKVVNPSMKNTMLGTMKVYYKDYLIDEFDVTYNGSLDYSLEGLFNKYKDYIIYGGIGFIVSFITIRILRHKKIA